MVTSRIFFLKPLSGGNPSTCPHQVQSRIKVPLLLLDLPRKGDSWVHAKPLTRVPMAPLLPRDSRIHRILQTQPRCTRPEPLRKAKVSSIPISRSMRIVCKRSAPPSRAPSIRGSTHTWRSCSSETSAWVESHHPWTLRRGDTQATWAFLTHASEDRAAPYNNYFQKITLIQIGRH